MVRRITLAGAVLMLGLTANRPDVFRLLVDTSRRPAFVEESLTVADP
jgi:hypothetical protein